MKSKLTKEIECLKRLQETTNQLDDILGFLKQEGLIDDSHVRSVKHSADHPKEIQFLLRNLQVTQKLQLLQYEWNVLPVENIVIFIISERNQREFVYNG